VTDYDTFIAEVDKLVIVTSDLIEVVADLTGRYFDPRREVLELLDLLSADHLRLVIDYVKDVVLNELMVWADVGCARDDTVYLLMR
jgi:hypothetical protein